MNQFPLFPPGPRFVNGYLVQPSNNPPNQPPFQQMHPQTNRPAFRDPRKLRKKEDETSTASLQEKLQQLTNITIPVEKPHLMNKLRINAPPLNVSPTIKPIKTLLGKKNFFPNSRFGTTSPSHLTKPSPVGKNNQFTISKPVLPINKQPAPPRKGKQNNPSSQPPPPRFSIKAVRPNSRPQKQSIRRSPHRPALHGRSPMRLSNSRSPMQPPRHQPSNRGRGRGRPNQQISHQISPGQPLRPMFPVGAPRPRFQNRKRMPSNQNWGSPDFRRRGRPSMSNFNRNFGRGGYRNRGGRFRGRFATRSY